MNLSAVDLHLIRKYNVATPRYTSYPPATQFTKFDASFVRQRLSDVEAIPQPLSLYFHIPFCQSQCWFCGCTNVVTTRQSASRTYLRYLEKEMALVARGIHPESRVVQVHLGGGTPTFLLPEELRHLGELIRRYFPQAETVEAGVEMDPRRLLPDHFAALRDAGFKRASIGVQDIHSDVQRAIHRLQPFEQIEAVVADLRAHAFSSINIDLIYGLPHQTAESFSRTLDAVLTLRPERLAVFNYAHVPWIKPAQKILTDLPDPEEKIQILALTIEKLTLAGYKAIGMDHFALATDDLAVAQENKTLQRNFQGYSTCGRTDILAFGMSAISQNGHGYFQNEKIIPAYYSHLDQAKLTIVRGWFLTEDDKIRGEWINRLMCDLELDYTALSNALQTDVRSYFASELSSLDDLEQDGLLIAGKDGLQVTPMGRLLIRNIAVRFDAYAAQRSHSAFSQAI